LRFLYTIATVIISAHFCSTIAAYSSCFTNYAAACYSTNSYSAYDTIITIASAVGSTGFTAGRRATTTAILD
jgi:hypothetical protein